MLNDYIQELKANSVWEGGVRFIELDEAINILEKFEVNFIDELDCEELLKLKNGYNKIPQS